MSDASEQSRASGRPFRLVCVSCGTTYRAANVVPGRMGACRRCNGRLRFSGTAALACPACGQVTPARQVDSSVKVPCPHCGEAMAVQPPAGESLPSGQKWKREIPSLGQSVRKDPAASLGETDESEERTRVLGQRSGSGAPEPLRSAAPPADTGGGPTAEVKASHAARPRRKKPKRIDPLGGGGRLPETFGRYRILARIAKGGMGVVYKAEDPELQRTIALKVLMAGEGVDETSLKRFLLEARAAARLRHPNIVPVHEVGEIGGTHYFTMDFIEGPSLGRLLDRKKVPVRRVVEWLRTICYAVDFAHRKGIVHRDLKPQNILVDAEGRPCVTDFGLAKDLTATTALSLTGAIFGTPEYMSPEQAQGRTHAIDRRTDVYSMGIVLYEAVTGQRPFHGKTMYDTIQSVVRDEPARPRTLKPVLDVDLETIILRCLEKDPAGRYASMADLATDLERYLAGEEIAARPLSAPRRLLRRVRRSPALLALAIGVPLLLGALIVGGALVARGDLVRTVERAVATGDPDAAAAALRLLETGLRTGEIGGGTREERALAATREALRGLGPEAGRTALAIVRLRKDASAAEGVLAVAGDAELDPGWRTLALQTLSLLGESAEVRPESVAPGLVELARTTDRREIRVATFRTLASFRTHEALQYAFSVAGDPAEAVEVRVAAVRTIGEGVMLGSAAMEMLLELQAGEEPAVADAASRMLAGLRTPGRILSAYGLEDRAARGVAEVARLNQQRNRQLNALMDEIAGDVGNSAPDPEPQPSPVEVLSERLGAEEPPVRLQAAFDLGVLGGPEAVPPLVDALDDSDGRVRRTAARALLRLSGTVRIPAEPVAAHLASGEPLIRETTARLLGELRAEAARPALIRALAGESSPRALEALVTALGKIGGEPALDAVRAASERTHGEAQLACLRALKHFGASAVPPLADALASSYPEVRDTAHAMLKEVTGEDFGTDAAAWRGWAEARARPAE